LPGIGSFRDWRLARSFVAAGLLVIALLRIGLRAIGLRIAACRSKDPIE
jgi:hypothetical protein